MRPHRQGEVVHLQNCFRKRPRLAVKREGVGTVTERYAEIDEVIAYIHQHIYEPLPLTRLAGHVAYSPYHFARIFKERIGLSPLYYVSSLRLQRAKDLLLRTNLSVRAIGLEIGQQSLGTFTTRFTQRVGLTPSEFRHSTLQADHHLRDSDRPVCQADPGRTPPLRNPAPWVGGFLFDGGQPGHLLPDGHIGLLGDGGAGCAAPPTPPR